MIDGELTEWCTVGGLVSIIRFVMADRMSTRIIRTKIRTPESWGKYLGKSAMADTTVSGRRLACSYYSPPRFSGCFLTQKALPLIILISPPVTGIDAADLLTRSQSKADARGAPTRRPGGTEVEAVSQRVQISVIPMLRTRFAYLTMASALGPSYCT